MIPKKEWARDTLRMLLLLGAAVAVCSVLSRVHDDNNPFAVLIFVLAVAIVALVTNGYVWGVLASVIGVFCVNYMFTYPFWSFDMSITGYPLTFVVMLVVSVVISTLTTRVKQTERLRYEIESEKLRADLLRALSHDLRTPLASIEGADSLLLEQPDLSEAERRTLLEQIRQETRWLTRITENMLSVTRMAGEQVSLHRTDEVVEEIVDSAVMKLRRSRNALPVTVIRPQEILTAPMDATLMEQVILNLLENAVNDAEGATRIRVEIAGQGDTVMIAVEDDGAGFPPELLPQLFDRIGELLLRNEHRLDIILHHVAFPPEFLKRSPFGFSPKRPPVPQRRSPPPRGCPAHPQAEPSPGAGTAGSPPRSSVFSAIGCGGRQAGSHLPPAGNEA